MGKDEDVFSITPVPFDDAPQLPSVPAGDEENWAVLTPGGMVPLATVKAEREAATEHVRLEKPANPAPQE